MYFDVRIICYVYLVLRSYGQSEGPKCHHRNFLSVSQDEMKNNVFKKETNHRYSYNKCVYYSNMETVTDSHNKFTCRGRHSIYLETLKSFTAMCLRSETAHLDRCQQNVYM